MGRLGGKVAAITGAGSGIGKATATVFAREGAKLVLCDTRADYLEKLVPTLDGGTHQTVVGDISLESTAVAIARAAEQAFGGLDVLVANVGLMFFKDITEVTVEEFDHLMAVNVRGMVLSCKHALPLMLRRKAGSIVIVSSGSAFRGQEFDGVSTFAYNMTKAAVRQLAISLATRYAADGIRVNAIAPGLMETPASRSQLPPGTLERIQGMQMLNKLQGNAEDIAALALFLGAEEARFITCEIVSCDAGNRLRGWRY
jgi:meso-butanediol dehydrogenase / (S,S)-butanediol dehydrogenase / diacetyl reductase